MDIILAALAETDWGAIVLGVLLIIALLIIFFSKNPQS